MGTHGSGTRGCWYLGAGNQGGVPVNAKVTIRLPRKRHYWGIHIGWTTQDDTRHHARVGLSWGCSKIENWRPDE